MTGGGLPPALLITAAFLMTLYVLDKTGVVKFDSIVQALKKLLRSISGDGGRTLYPSLSSELRDMAIQMGQEQEQRCNAATDGIVSVGQLSSKVTTASASVSSGATVESAKSNNSIVQASIPAAGTNANKNAGTNDSVVTATIAGLSGEGSNGRTNTNARVAITVRLL